MNGKTKILATFMALGMVTTGFALLTPTVAAADPQTIWQYAHDYNDGVITDFYNDAGGNEGWTVFWTDMTDTKPAVRGGSATTWMYAAGPNFLTAGAWIMDNLYPDPSGWLYNSQCTIIMENATGYSCFNYIPDTGGGSPLFAPDVLQQQVPVPVPLELVPGDVDLTWTAFQQTDEFGGGLPVVDAQLAGYMIYRYSPTIGTPASTWNDNPVMGPVVGVPGDWVLVAGSAAAPIVGLTWTDVGIMTDSGNTHYYSIKPVCLGQSPASNIDFKYGGLGAGIDDGGGTDIPPEITASASSGTIHDGDHANEQITLTGTVSDAMHVELNIIQSCEIQITDPNAVTYGPFAMAMTTGGGTTIESFDYVWNFPDAAPEGVYTYQMRGTDDGSPGANATWDLDGYFFTITDIIDPTVAWSPLSTPDGVGRAVGVPSAIHVDYVDFTAYSAATLYWWNPLFGEAVRANSIAMTNTSFFFGSFNNRLSETIVAYGAVGDTIFYDVDVSDSSNGGPLTVQLIPPRTIIVTEAAIAPGDPYPIYGYTLQYDGTIAGGYAPTFVPGSTVTVDWYNNTLGAWTTITTVSDANAQFSVDLLNYTDLGFVYVNVTVNGVWAGSLGYNWTQIDVVGFPGGRWQDVICGVPYNVTITVPVSPPIPNIQLTAIFPVTYEITDRNGILAYGYYTYVPIDPDRGFVNITAGPMIPAPHSYITDADQTFDGTISATPATYTANMQMIFPGLLWWINVSEGGQAWPDTYYLTPWNGFFIDPALTINGTLKDWDNITINLEVGGFDWLLTQGWNMVSCPQDATFRVGVNVTFDSEDALDWVNIYLLANFGVTDPALSMANRIGGNPSTYMVYDVGTGEAAAFDTDTLHGYWVYLSIAGAYVIHFDSLNATTTGMNETDAPIEAGWNLMGYQHNYTLTWLIWPTASMWTTGAAGIDQNNFLWMSSLGGARTKLVITEWTGAKWYNSYVVDDTPPGFPGMPTKDWIWNPTLFSTNPGCGFWIWSDAGGTITYSTVL